VRLALALIAVACSSERSAPKPAAKPPEPVAVHDAAAPLIDAEVPPKWASDPPEVLRDKINGVNAHIIVLKNAPKLTEYRDVLAKVERTPGVVAAEAFIFAELAIAKASGGGEPVSVALKAVDPARVGRVLAFASKMKTGSLDALAKGTPPPILLGDVLAGSLGVAIGDDVTISRPKEIEDALPDLEKIKPTAFRVAGTFHIDFDEYDERLALVPLAAMQKLLARGDEVMGIEMTVKDLSTSDELAEKIEATLGGPPYEVLDWYELNKNLFTTLFGSRRP
jgi:lipoprotein-releasing system permease protein